MPQRPPKLPLQRPAYRGKTSATQAEGFAGLYLTEPGAAFTQDPDFADAALLLDLPKTGTVLGVSRSAVFELLRSGLLPAVKLGRRTLVRKSDLERFIANLATANYRPPSIKPNPKRMRRCG